MQQDDEVSPELRPLVGTSSRGHPRYWAVHGASGHSDTSARRQKTCPQHMGFVLAVLLSAALLITACLVVGLPPMMAHLHEEQDPLLPPPPSASRLAAYTRGAVSADTTVCPAVGRLMLARNGSAVDAAIAMLLCQGVSEPHLSGLGGGFFMVAYSTRGGAVVLDAREAAPSGVRVMDTPSHRGGMSVAVPSMARGLWQAHQRFGVLPWGSLFQPSIRMCEHGVPVSTGLADHLTLHRNIVMADPVLREVMTRPGAPSDVLRPGDMLRNKRLADTLKVLAAEDGESLHTGPLAADMARDVRRRGGVITSEDMASYSPKWKDAVSSRLWTPSAGVLTLHTTPAPSSGPVLVHLLNVLEAFNMTSAMELEGVHGRVTFLHRLVEIFKHALAKRPLLGDPDFVNLDEVMGLLLSKDYARSVRWRVSDFQTVADPSYYGPVMAQAEDSGTTHVSVLAPDGDAVAITASLNHRFGSGVMSDSTGVLLNNHMADFSGPGDGSLASRDNRNLVRPGKRPLSSMTPCVFTDAEGRVRLVVGASGGLRILTTVALVCARHLWLGDDLKQAVDARRLHHQLLPDTLFYEYGMTRQVVQGLHRRGHRTQRVQGTFSVVTAVARTHNGTIFANSDFRRGGAVEGIN